MALNKEEILMKFTCKQQDICSAINSVSKAVSVKSTITALEGMKLRLSYTVLELTGYDLELGIRAIIPVESEDCGEFVVNARLFSEITRKMTDEMITFETDEMLNIHITGAVTEYFISAIAADEYPDLPVVGEENSIVLPQAQLKSMINQTNYAVSLNENKPVLTGELFDIAEGCFHMVASDGFRLALRAEPLENDGTYHFIVPSRTLGEVSRLLKEEDEAPCTIYMNKKHIVFSLKECTVFSRLLEGDFHNYKASIPKEHRTEVFVKTRELISCLERCSLLINEKNKAPIRCVFENGSLHISCKTGIGSISDTIPVDLSGDTLTIGVNNKFLLDAIRATESDKVCLHLSGSNRVIKIIPPQGESYVFLVMPVELKG